MGNTVSDKNHKKSLVSLIAAIAMLTGCSTTTPEPEPVVIAQTPTINSPEIRVEKRPSLQLPEGVVRYCWEEPIVKIERQNPGITQTGHWYKPAHVSVREIRSGKWRPCKVTSSQAY